MPFRLSYLDSGYAVLQRTCWMSDTVSHWVICDMVYVGDAYKDFVGILFLMLGFFVIPRFPSVRKDQEDQCTQQADLWFQADIVTFLEDSKLCDSSHCVALEFILKHFLLIIESKHLNVDFKFFFSPEWFLQNNSYSFKQSMHTCTCKMCNTSVVIVHYFIAQLFSPYRHKVSIVYSPVIFRCLY